VIGDSVHHDREGQYVTTHDEKVEQELTPAENLASPSAEENLTSASHGMDMAESLLELTNDIARVGCHGSESEEKDQSWNDTNLGHGVRECEDTEGNGFRDHDHSGLPEGRSVWEKVSRQDFNTYHQAMDLYSTPFSTRLLAMGSSPVGPVAGNVKDSFPSPSVVALRLPFFSPSGVVVVPPRTSPLFDVAVDSWRADSLTTAWSFFSGSSLLLKKETMDCLMSPLRHEPLDTVPEAAILATFDRRKSEDVPVSMLDAAPPARLRIRLTE
jgi:hypothetical protein